MRNLILLVCLSVMVPFLALAQETTPSLVIECETEGTLSGIDRDPNTWSYENVYLKGRFDINDLQVIGSALEGVYIRVLNCKDAWFVKSGEDKPFQNITAILEDGTFPRNIPVYSDIVVMPKDLKKIIRWQYTTALNIVLPEGIEYIDQYAFEWQQIASINLPQSIRYIGAGAFYSANIETLRLPDGIKIIEDTCIVGVKDKIHLPDNLEEVAYNGVSFYGKSLTIPAGLSRIAPHGFNIPFLDEIHSLAPNPPYCDPELSDTDMQGCDGREFYSLDSCLMNVDKSRCVLYVPKGSVEMYRNAREWSNFVNIREEAEDYAEDLTGFSEWDNVEFHYSDVTSISDIRADVTAGEKQYFDLQGRKLTSPVRGINIVVTSSGATKEIHP